MNWKSRSFKAIRAQLTARIYHLQRDLLALKQAVSPADGCLSPARAGGLAVDSAGYTSLFQDVHDHVMRIAGLIDNLQQLSHTALEATCRFSVAQNDDTKRLAAWAAILPCRP